MAVVAGKWIDQATGIGKATERVFKGFWPKAGDAILFEGGRSLLVVDAVRGKSYTTGNGTVWDAWPPTPKVAGKALQIVRAHTDIERIDDAG